MKYYIYYCSVEVKYTGDFNDYTPEDWEKMARVKADRCDPCDRVIEVNSYEEAKKLEKGYTVEDYYPANKLALVKWADIVEMED